MRPFNSTFRVSAFRLDRAQAAIRSPRKRQQRSRPAMNRRTVILSVLTVAALIGAVACSDDKPKQGSATSPTQQSGSSAPRAASTSVPFAPAGSTSAAAPGSTADLVKRARPSVVRVRASAGGGPGGQAAGTGTGFVVDERGYIVTNNH